MYVLNWRKRFARYGWNGVYCDLEKKGYKRSFSGMEVPYNILRGAARRNNRRFGRRTAIDECTRMRLVYAFEEYTPDTLENTVKMLMKAFPFKIKAIQTDNGTEFTYKFISKSKQSPMDVELKKRGITHVLIPPRTPWHNGKVERSHRNEQR